MPWSFAQLSQLYTWTETGVLSHEQLQGAAKLSPLRLGAASWARAGNIVCAFAGALLLATALVFFFAYNWAELHRFAKLGTALVAIAACGVVALRAEPFSTSWRAALSALILCIGALLALVGQIYQTGANTWQLFATWSVLSLPAALLSRSSMGAAIWFVVANTTIYLYLDVIWRAREIFIITAFNVAMLALLEIFHTRWLTKPRRLVHILLALGAVLPLTYGAFLGWTLNAYQIVLVVFFIVTTGFAAFYALARKSLPMLAIAGYAMIIVTTAGLFRWMSNSKPGDQLFFVEIVVVGIYIVLTANALTKWIWRQHRSGEALEAGQ